MSEEIDTERTSNIYAEMNDFRLIEILNEYLDSSFGIDSIDYAASKEVIKSMREYGDHIFDCISQIHLIQTESFNKTAPYGLPISKYSVSVTASVAAKFSVSEGCLKDFAELNDHQNYVISFCKDLSSEIIHPYIRSLLLSGSGRPIGVFPRQDSEVFLKSVKQMASSNQVLESSDEFIETVHKFISTRNQIIRPFLGDHQNIEAVFGLFWNLKNAFGEVTVMTILDQVLIENPVMTLMDLIDVCNFWDETKGSPLTWSLELLKVDANNFSVE